MSENVLLSFEIMLKGMGGIFAACLIIMAAVWIMGKISGKKKLLKLCKNFIFSFLLYGLVVR